MALAVVGIGSNIGHRLSNIERAVALISGIPDVRNFRCSTVIETEPWGFESPNRFLNACVAFDTDIDPVVLFDHLRNIERMICESAHRNASGAYVDRIIDIDFIACDTHRLSTPDLILPHPRAVERDFVMKPFEEIAPDLCGKIREMFTDNCV
ncbi:MAG: 2-amino-4-hydroxy-6-hydroxymethyldihydropteridine diphosphokinase [Duncaniella sp.]|nr:2-amino-4-hydroxy-6-hydroxymethyldihydropteridine diphosphokinase [Duncaniella sp.]MDE6581222.1 2-amino-4-hydroxy-6-hydroxymethyldihydropteridine diphosphokinase [Duncaniella sp.]